MRYIEIVFDNSGSMENYLDNDQRRIDVAKKLFETEILPTIAFAGDTIVLRTLRSSCNAASKGIMLPNDPTKIMNAINLIYADGGTPLYQTVQDAVIACKVVKADENFIFVLTDGGDTCNIPMDEIIDENARKWIKEWNVLLMQFAVDNAVTQNNLNIFGNYIGATSFSVGTPGRTSDETMRLDLRMALVNSRLNINAPLPWCFDSKEGPDESWQDLLNQGFTFYQASVLFEEGFLSWKPSWDKIVSPLQKAEFTFLRGLRFITALPKETVKVMLSGLMAPYYYSPDCIYWNFSEARWKFHPIQHPVKFTSNTEVELAEDNCFAKVDFNSEVGRRNAEHYFLEEVYEVAEAYNFLEVGFTLNRINRDLIRKGVKTLKVGQQVRFKK